MKLTKETLKRIIKEELEAVVNEEMYSSGDHLVLDPNNPNDAKEFAKINIRNPQEEAEKAKQNAAHYPCEEGYVWRYILPSSSRSGVKQGWTCIKQSGLKNAMSPFDQQL